MNQIFLLQNQEKLLLSKQKEWVDGRDLGSLFKTPHRDEALNQMVEVNAKDFSQRIRILAVGLKANGLPDIDPADLPPRTASAASQEDENTAPCGNDEALSTAPENQTEATGI